MHIEEFRPGSIGALMDEYEHAADELKSVLRSMTDAEYAAVANPTAASPEMRSIQAIMGHVVSSGFGYATYINAALGKTIARPAAQLYARSEICDRIDAVLRFTDDVLTPHYTMPEDDMDKITMQAPWNVLYTVDQMLEHAVMHIHRHRRQLQKYLVLLRS